MHPQLPDTVEACEVFLASCSAGDERKHGYYRAIRAFYHFLNRRFDLTDPTTKMDAPKRKPKQPKPLLINDLHQLITYPHPPKTLAALMFLTDTGARVSEACDLTLNDLSKSPWGYIARVKGKTGTRLLPISTVVYKALVKVLPFGYTRYRFRRMISLAFRNAHVWGSGINLRHTFGSYWEGDELVLQQIMGHSNLSTTKIYRQLRTQILSLQHHQFSPLRMVLQGRQAML